MAQFGTCIDDDLPVLDAKIKQLKTEYDQYFLGSRNREPGLLRSEVQKMVTLYANLRINNTAQRFRFNNLRARFFALRRQWDETVRKIEQGTYERHLFKVRLRERDARAGEGQGGDQNLSAGDTSLYEAYLTARQACGQDVASLSRDRLEAMLQQQREAILAKHGWSDVRFRVVVQDGKAKLKAVRA